MSRPKLWLRAARPFSFTVSFVPPILGLASAFYLNPGFRAGWFHFVLTFMGGFLAHAGSNMLSDYFDYKNEVDRDGTLGSSGVLVEKLMPAGELFGLSMACFAAAGIIGFYFIFSLKNGFSLVWLILAGGFLGFFYTTPPFNIKYKALGDAAVFLAFGPLMALGGYFVQTGVYSLKPFLYAVPVGLIVDAVLHANNTRDIESDRKAGIKTAAMLLGSNGSGLMYAWLIYGAYACIPALVIFAGLTPFSLLTFATLPVAAGNVRLVRSNDGVKLAGADALTAKLHSVFSLVLIIAMAVGTFLGKRPG